ncbi:snRNA-activating protein complex subunit 5 isoform X1 [Physeter macrocephalus]|uniref:snRNA-activating protein complex subunit 5 isoform X1 n=1 Tax=Physeter macrocephalus TaxID=9755 RepID=A0A2Y9FPI2_PHYMC|nr:snRNA-activating protein complex subunit 5 isoform X1 [Physeter catodon]XP_028350744.1 snRNA-activating protein complex subunit 5 isoform X1 [Physeter catodon]XP_028350745.1 snRNA-activating protein complex subunit 5 isoform X1 [Physeter catodon]XP_054944019.1 snRNA-activating protein complex subunit 5 isoform X1 [Physeter catodon]XP_058913810.1 snRNA-activating protein complex subunit 5 isoform X1 [Kogia breviceps]XP_058913811.1 snRNA-activating protein complex subunit 5 isoform X1 [Kogia |eukprot:XP_007127904.1 snRNA-activating protein complex subunit 5 isoform X1 [Physeter catodon]
MLSRLQELRKEEETLLRLKAALHDQLNRLKVEELALQSMISSRIEDEMVSSQPAPEQSHDQMLVHVDNEASINQTALELSTRSHVPEEEEEEEEEESDS